MKKIDNEMRDEIYRLIQDPKNGSSYRTRDRARGRLKKAGLIWFDRKNWTWVVKPEAVQQAERSKNDEHD